jgi:hypothetical protein
MGQLSCSLASHLQFPLFDMNSCALYCNAHETLIGSRQLILACKIRSPESNKRRASTSVWPPRVASTTAIGMRTHLWSQDDSTMMPTGTLGSQPLVDQILIIDLHCIIIVAVSAVLAKRRDTWCLDGRVQDMSWRISCTMLPCSSRMNKWSAMIWFDILKQKS